MSGLNAVMLVGEILPGASQAALNFVEDQQRSGAVAELSRGLQKFRAERTDSAFALNRLQANGADAAIKLALQIVNIIEADEIRLPAPAAQRDGDIFPAPWWPDEPKVRP